MVSAPAAVLPDEARVDGFRIVRRLGRGGFGITYLATEFVPALGQSGAEVPLRQVVLKEYFPHGVAERDSSRTVHPAQDLDGAVATFDSGLKAFVKEARTIARFDHDNIVRIHRVFEANGTAYFSMPYLKGESLAQILKRERTLSEERCRRLILPVVDGLEYAHAQGVLHRDIKPANIMVREDDGRPILIDFGNARVQTGDATRSAQLTDFLAFSPGFAALEQYARCTAENPHGPFTDVYALAALLYQACVGQEPPEATQRASQVYSGHPDPLLPCAELLRGKPAFSRTFLATIDWGLELAMQDRPQTMEEFRDALVGRISRRRSSRSRPGDITPDFALEPAEAGPGPAPTAAAMPTQAPEPLTERLPQPGLRTRSAAWEAPQRQPGAAGPPVQLKPPPREETRRNAFPAAAPTPPSAAPRAGLRWVVLAAGLAATAAVVLGLGHRTIRPEAGSAAPSPARGAPATPPVAAPPVEDPAARQHRLAMDALNQGNAAMAGDRRRDAADAYATALGLEPELKNEPALAAGLVACLSWASDLAEPLIQRYSSPAIIDALSKRSAEVGTLGAQRAANLLIALHHPDRIDPAYSLGVAIEAYKAAGSCEARLAALPRLRALHDPRALPVLRDSLGSGLGAWFKTRCYRSEVQAAIVELEGDRTRPADRSKGR